ncbi:GTP-binding protein [Candidatus Lokiarchaeum ossiferum]
MKLILMGNPSSGKSSILYRLFSREFQLAYMPTIGMDYYEKFFSKYNILANCLDFGGIDVIDVINSPFFKEVDVVLFVCDIFDNYNQKSFLKLSHSIKNQNSQKVHFIIVRNKCDLNPITNGESQKIDRFCGVNEFKYIHLSAKTMQNFDLLKKALFSSFSDQKEQISCLNCSTISDYN